MKAYRRVNFEDCDPFSHLNNSIYLNYFLNAREEQLRTHDVLDIFDHVSRTGKSWVVMSHNIQYIRPANLGEELEIWSRMLAHNKFINLIEFVMVGKESRQLKSVMHSQLAYISVKTGKPVAYEPELSELFDKVSLFPDEKVDGFDIRERIKLIKQEL